jgi:Mn-dependent DtxR family transcriptional regulator
MRSALWLFSYFVIHANRKDGTLRRKYETVARDMGLSLSTLRRWMTILKDNGYITVEQTGHAQLIHILR